MLDVRAPVPGTGWGCVVCGLPMDGALAVLCDQCVEERRPPVWVVYGLVCTGERVLLSPCSGAQSHRIELHPEAWGK